MSKIVRMKANDVNRDVAERLRAARERLPLTQAALAEKVGVSRATQVNYEAGKRSPDVAYLQAIGKVGVDVPYVLTGVPTSVDSIERRALVKTLSAICERLHVEYVGVLDAAYGEVEHEAGSRRVDGEKESANASVADEVETAIVEALDKIELDAKLLGDVLGLIESVLEADELVLRPTKKADVAVTLYQTFKRIGRSDFSIAEQVIQLAATGQY